MKTDVTARHRELTDSPAKREAYNAGARYVVAPGKSLCTATDSVLGPGDRVEPEYLLRSHDAEAGMARIQELVGKGIIVDRGEQ